MLSLAKFIRNTPVNDLRTYFDRQGFDLREPVNWDGAEREIAKPLLKLVDHLSEPERAALTTDLERIGVMTDELGQMALLSVVLDRDQLEAMENAFARALRVFLNDPSAFRRAEEVRYADNYRQGRMWDGFLGPAGVAVEPDAEQLTKLKNSVMAYFRSDRAIVEIYLRTRPNFEEPDSDLVQVTVYREGLSETFLEFDGEELARRRWRPVYEAAMTYEPATGVIEVVARGRECREDLARMFAETLLCREIETERVPVRRYDLAPLLHPFEFPTDPEDGIDSVKLVLLRLRPYDDPGKRITLEATRKAVGSISAAAQDWFDQHNPLRGGFVATQARLSIKFHPDSESRRGKILPVTVTMPNGCDLKSKTEKERLIGEKYLARWGLVREI